MLLNLVNKHHTVTDNRTGERQNTQLRHKAQRGIEQQQAEDNADYTHRRRQHNNQQLADILHLQHNQNDNQQQHQRYRLHQIIQCIVAVLQRTADLNAHAGRQLLAQRLQLLIHLLGNIVAGNAVNNTAVDGNRRTQVAAPDDIVLAGVVKMRNL